MTSLMRDLLFKDFGWKIFSVGLAVLIWLTVHRILEEHTPGSPVTFGQVPVLIVASAADVHSFRVTPATVEVTVSGTSEAMALLHTNQIHADVDLTDFPDNPPPGDSWRAVDVSVPPGITVLQVAPAKVGVIIPPPAH